MARKITTDDIAGGFWNKMYRNAGLSDKEIYGTDFTKELPGSRIEVTIDNDVYQVDTLGQRDPVKYAVDTITKLRNESR